MRNLIRAVVAVAALAGEGRAQWPVVRTGTLDAKTRAPAVAPARLQPVVGSVRRESHFANPITKKARYSALTFNPVGGTFSKTVFRR